MALNKTYMRNFYIFLAAVFIVVGAEFFSSQEYQEVEFSRGKLTIETAHGKSYDFRIEIADTPERQERGLMFRRSMDEDAGMLFTFQNEQEISFWMKNTYIPLDMLFMDKTGRIVDIVKNAIPMSTASIAPKHPAIAVLEVTGGLANELEIEEGDRVRHPFFEK